MKNKLLEMMSNIPTEKIGNVDNEILRAGIISEMDAINLYEQLANIATDETVKKALLDIATEEKTHVGEFESLLKKLDKNFDDELKSGVEEIESMKEARERIYGKKATKQLNEMKNIFNKLIK